MSNVTIALVAGAVIAGAAYLYKKLRRPTGFPPGPPAFPIIGSLPYLGESDDQYDFHEALQKLGKKHGPVFSIAFGHTWVVMLNDIDSIKEAMVKQGVDFAGRPIYENAELWNPYAPSHGIADSTYSEQWKLQRHTAMQVLRSLGYGRKITEECIIEEAEIMIEAFKKKGTTSIDVQDHLSNAVANVIISLLFGYRYEYENRDFTKVRHCIDRAFAATDKLLKWDYIPGKSLIPSYRQITNEIKDAYKEMNGFLKQKIDEINCDDQMEYPRNFIEGYHMERQRNPKIENRILQITSDFIQAGMETTTTTLGWAIYFMIAYPKVQEKVQDEIDLKVGHQRRPVLSDRESMPFVEATLLEVLRLASTAPITLPHITIASSTVQGYSIPKGTEVWANIWAVLRNPDDWPEPETFRPERFLGPDGKVKHNEKFIPFGVGRRSCMGEQLAKQELFLFFTNIMHAFKVSSPTNQKLPEAKGSFALTHRPPKFDICVTCRQ